MNLKSVAAQYLYFSRKSRTGVVTLVLLVLLVYAIPYLIPVTVTQPIVLADSLLVRIDSLSPPRVAGYQIKDEFDYNPAPSLREPDFTKGELFTFDPNTLDAAGWQRLGLREKTVRTIVNYRNKGGQFYKKEDLQRIWGLPKGFYERVEDYIQVPPRENAGAAKTPFADKKPFAPKRPSSININTADTSAWIALPGIGAKLAARIVNFRNKLGGFVSVEQVATTYGLPDSTFQKIKPMLQLEEGKVSKININTATKEQLSQHPYINWKLANAIVAYREQHGAYQSIDDLKKIMIMDEATFSNLKPYLGLQ